MHEHILGWSHVVIADHFALAKFHSLLLYQTNNDLKFVSKRLSKVDGIRLCLLMCMIFRWLLFSFNTLKCLLSSWIERSDIAED